MAYENTKAEIAKVIKTNLVGGISGDEHQTELFRAIDALGDNYSLLGVAEPDDAELTLEGDSAWFATEIGTYTNKGGVVISAAGLYLITYDADTDAYDMTQLIAATSAPDLSDYDEIKRKTLTPSSYVSYLPESEPFTTPSIPANTSTKVLIPTTIKDSLDFLIVDKGEGDFAVQYTGTEARTFEISMSTGMTTSANNVLFDIYMYNNDVVEEGVGVPRKIGTGADVGAIATTGEFVAEPGAFLEVYIKVSLTTTVTFYRTSIRITEKN